MDIPDLDARLQRLTDTLAHLLAGDFEAIATCDTVPDDPFGRVEQTVQRLVADIETATTANREKEASLLAQQGQLEAQAARIQSQQRDLRAKAETIEIQAAAIRELSTPLLELWEGVLALPIVGVIDTQRSLDIMEQLLERIAQTQVEWVILDITGVEFVDTHTADHLIKVVRAASLLGATCMLSGVQPAVARTFVDLGVDLSELDAKRNLQQALRECLRRKRDD
ncbi:STAS domain-containing protein [Pseudenhygromyxa sp. WMMC2535]|uniref:STAS domain-containing protein n=1 Tax=Pseudenhygromyxa sp. WMMC2535 TaxID=2712867 RepID=UPI0015539FDC|nr:STAS domain-containing protein [Pseudenhygromyxa sp. WMMC2535]NVB43147.1 STAS domain-containing protein [Pseudenhygromyxa sp. WMMC2535]